MSKETFLALAYLLIWGGLLAYLAVLTSRQRTLARRIGELAAGSAARQGD